MVTGAPLAALALAGAVLCWPGGAGLHRLAGVLDLRRPRWQRGANQLSWRHHRGPALIGASCMVGVIGAGVGGGLAAALAAAVLYRRVRNTGDDRRRLAAAGDLAEGLTDLVGSLRAGAHPAAAAADVETQHADVRAVLATISTTARLGGDVPSQLRQRAEADPILGAELGTVAAAWAMAQRHGVPLAELLDAVRCDVDARVRFGQRVRAQLAGARATAGVLAALPVVGVLLGEALGAHPWLVLSGTTTGQVLLVIGVALGCAGVGWADRITTGAVWR